MTEVHLAPYFATVTTTVKGRWFNRYLLDVLVDEFRSKTREQHLCDMQKSWYTVHRASLVIRFPELLSVRLQNKDVVHGQVHRHESPVRLAGEIQVLETNNSYIVVNKPSGLPVHPTTNKYYYNTLTHMLQTKLGLHRTPSPCFRLDKLTSGLIILNNNDNQMQKLIQANKSSIQKQYVARVVGEFPDHELTVDSPITNIDTKFGYTKNKSNIKSAITKFKKLKYLAESNESIVLCQPITGRTHQIRIHLNLINHPISNDPIYGTNSSKFDTISRLIKKFPELDPALYEQLEQLDQRNLAELKHGTTRCDVCDATVFTDPVFDELYLHSLRYKLTGFFDFSTSLPSWAGC